MKDVTQQTCVWLLCCKEVWHRWFEALENGEDEFLEVEEALFSSLVLSFAGLADRPSLSNCHSFLHGVYRVDVDEHRSVCTAQRTGTIFCTSKALSFAKGTSLPIRSLDWRGVMLNGNPCAELAISAHEWVLEPISNLNIMVDTPLP